jgi:O-antigen/teichoic acid export membrane protein
MSNSKKVVTNTLFLYIRTIVSLMVSVFTTRILLHALGASDYGLYNVIGGAISMLGFLIASMSSATQRFLSYAEGAGDRNKIIVYLNNSILIHYGLALFMILVFAVSALFFFNGVLNIPEGRHGAAIIIYICMLVSTVFSITIVPYDAEINAHENMLFYSVLGIIDVMFKLSIALAVLYFHSDKLIFYSVLMAAESFVLRYICQQYCKRHYSECRHINLRKYYNKKIVKELTSFAGWNLSNVATGMLALYGMNIVINHYFGTGVNAAMGIATQLSGVMMGVSMNMIKAITPVLVKAEGGKQRQRMLDISYVSCKFSYLLFSFACLPVLFFLPKILSTWLTSVPQWTSSFCTVLVIATLVEQLTIVLYQSILAVGDIRNYNVVHSIANILSLFLNVIVFHYFRLPPYWVFINWLVFKSILGGAINLYYAHEKLELSFSRYVQSVIFPSALSTLASVVLGVLLVRLCHTYQVNDLIGVVVMFVIMAPIFWVASLTQGERSLFLSFFQKTKKLCI